MAEKKGRSAGGILEGLTSFLEKLEQVAEKGEELKASRAQEFDTQESGAQPSGKRRGVLDMNLRVGSLGQQSSIPRVQPVKANRREARAEETTVQPIREPLVDVFDEGAEVLVVTELPGVEPQDVSLELHEDILTLHAEREGLKYHKEVLLPRRYDRRQMHTSHRNGVLEIRFTQEGEEEGSG